MFKVQRVLYLFISAVFSIIILIFPACKSLPGGPGTADNPLDSDNPNNTFNGTALVLSPTALTINSTGQFSIELWIVDADSIAGFNTKIEFDPDKLQIENVDFLDTGLKSMLLDNGGKLINFEDTDNTGGCTVLDCAVVEGTPGNVLGTGVLARIRFKHLSGSQADIDIAASAKFRNKKNETVNIDSYIGSKIMVK